MHTHIGYGSPQQDTAAVHGSPLGAEDLEATKEALGWPTEPRFHVPDEVYEHCRQAVAEGREQEIEWSGTVNAYREAHPDSCELFLEAMEGEGIAVAVRDRKLRVSPTYYNTPDEVARALDAVASYGKTQVAVR